MIARHWRWLCTLVLMIGLAAPWLAAPRGGAAASGGGVAAWGYNRDGQLGNGAVGEPNNSAVPVTVLGVGGSGALGNITAVAAGQGHSLALRADGTVLAWGSNEKGQLGIGTSGSGSRSATPVAVQDVGGGGTLGGVRAIAAGINVSFAVKNDGSVVAWGENAQGALGTDAVAEGAIRAVPIALKGAAGPGAAPLTGVRAVAPGMALKNDGTVLVWGNNTFGRAGDGTRNDAQIIRTPTAVPSLGAGSGVVAIAGFSSHLLVLKGDGTVLSWGFNQFGALGRASEAQCPVIVFGFDLGGPCGLTPAPVQGVGGAGNLGAVSAIATGLIASLALRTDGSVVAWGANTFRQLGSAPAGATCPDNRDPCSVVPLVVEGVNGNGTLGNVRAIAIGQDHGLALRNDGTVVAWGGQGAGERGDGATTANGVPALVRGVGGTGLLGAVKLITAGLGASLAILDGGAVPLPAFGDVTAATPYADAIRQLAARGVIKGCDQSATPPLFCPGDPTLRAQMAALIGRAMGYADSPVNPFTDKCDPNDPGNCVDVELWNRVAQLAARDVARGYTDAATCAPAATPCYGPRDPVLHAQTISFITRAMVNQGAWVAATSDNPAIYPNIPASSGHRLDFVTYVANVGPVPGTAAATEQFPQWNQPSTRGWFAQALWLAIKDR